MGSGTRMIAIHNNDQTTHEWVKYDSIFDVKYIQKKEPIGLLCPRCEHYGRVNVYRNQNNIVCYVVAHEKINGKWGKGRGARTRHRRCYIIKTKQKNIVEEILGINKK